MRNDYTFTEEYKAGLRKMVSEIFDYKEFFFVTTTINPEIVLGSANDVLFVFIPILYNKSFLEFLQGEGLCINMCKTGDYFVSVSFN